MYKGKPVLIGSSLLNLVQRYACFDWLGSLRPGTKLCLFIGWYIGTVNGWPVLIGLLDVVRRYTFCFELAGIPRTEVNCIFDLIEPGPGKQPTYLE